LIQIWNKTALSMKNLRIKAVRRARKLSQREVAERLHLSQSAYAKLEQGCSKIDIDRLLQLTEIFAVPLEQLLPATENPAKPMLAAGSTPNSNESLRQKTAAVYERQIAQLRETIQALRASQEQMQTTNGQLVQEIRGLRDLLGQRILEW
jgi:transcriptional regulator with XRE-family HTH domain